MIIHLRGEHKFYRGGHDEAAASQLKFQRRFPNEGSPQEIVRTLPSSPLLCAALGLIADRLNFATALRPRSVSTQFLQMIAGNVTLTLRQARQTLGRLAANFVSFLIRPHVKHAPDQPAVVASAFE